MLSIWMFAYLITLYIRPQDWMGCFLYKVPVTDIIVVAGLIAGYINIVRTKRTIKTPHLYAILAFVALAFITNAANGNSVLGWAQLVILFKRFLIYVMVLLHLDSPKRIRQFLFFSMILMVILSFQAVYQRLHGTGWAHQRIHSRVGPIDNYEQEEYAVGKRVFWIGLWDGPNVLALPFLALIPFCLDATFRKGKSLPKRIIYISSFFLLYLGVFLTNSRGGFLSLIIIIGVFFLLGFKRHWKVLAFLFLFPLLFTIQPSRMNIFTLDESSAHERSWLWEQGYNMMREHPMFGIGKGSFASNVGARIISHNNYVENMAEMGIPGLLVYVAIVYISLKGCFLVYLYFRRRDREDELFHLARMWLITLIGYYCATFLVVMEEDFLYVLWAVSAAIFLVARGEHKEITFPFTLKDCGLITAGSMVIVTLVYLISEEIIYF